jgi:phosphocarrier protein FPr/phosphocarrier protein
VAYLPAPREDNPALGLRGVRLSLARPALLDAQIRAALRVRPIGVCRIMAPMIASLEELRAVRAALDRARAAFGVTAPVALGVMIETPAAAMIAADLAAEADFLSIGTNDLTQYALAMDRTNPSVASGIDALHPAVIRLIALTCEGAARAGKGVGVCGGLASEALAAPLLIGLGVTELSAAPAAISALKSTIRPLTMQACRDLATKALAASTAESVRAVLKAAAH